MTNRVFGLALFCRNTVVAMERGVDGMPAQARAFDARWKLEYAGKDLELAKMIVLRFDIEVPGYHAVKLIEQHVGVVTSLALERLGHHRRRCL